MWTCALCKSELSQSDESRVQQTGSSKAHSKPTVFNSWQQREEIPANSAFKKCFKYDEARELKELIEQQKRLKNITDNAIWSPVLVASNS